MTRGSGARRHAAWRGIWRYAAQVARSTAAGGLAALMAACGGQAFVLSSDAGTGPETPGTNDASQEAAANLPDANILLCNPMGAACAFGSTCCTDTGTTWSCTGGACGPCNTGLQCTSDANCRSATTPHCCVAPVANMNCSGNQSFQSACKALCATTETRLCDPAGAASCPPGKTCSVNTGDLQKWGLPAGKGYGVCM